MACGIDLLEMDVPWGDDCKGDGAGEALLSVLSEYEVGDTSCIGDEFFQPKKDVSLLGPGDLGVFVIILGSEGSSSFVGRPDGCKDIDRCRPSFAGTFVVLDGS